MAYQTGKMKAEQTSKKLMGASRVFEREILKKYISPLLASQPYHISCNEDAAVIDFPPGQNLVITSDLIIEGVHFLPEDPPETIAKKAIRVNLSDLASMGAHPLGYNLCLGIGNRFTEDWMERFSLGLSQDHKEFNISLLGGDLSKTNGPTTISLTAIGDIGSGKAIYRHKAQPGDRIYVSGTIGDAALGLKVLQGALTDLTQSQEQYLIEKYRLPTPRQVLAQSLREIVHSAIDISDGLLLDLQLVCKASQLHAYIRRDRIPLSKTTKQILKSLPADKRSALFDLVLAGGDDYELLFTVSSGETEHIDYLAQRYRIPLTCIGHLGAIPELERTTVHSQENITLLDNKGRELVVKELGYQHQWET